MHADCEFPQFSESQFFFIFVVNMDKRKIFVIYFAFIGIAVLAILTMRRSPVPSEGVTKLKYKVLNNVLLSDELLRIDAMSKELVWTTNRHAHYPTTDITISDLWELDMLMCKKLRELILPEVCKLFAVEFESLWLRDMFLVKYEHDAQRKLALHRDASDFSFVLHVNPLHEFDGGGTYFSKTNQTVGLMPGQCLIFSGKEQHAGVEITRGRRLIITGFIDCDKSPSTLRRQYLMYNLRCLVERRMFEKVGFHTKVAQRV